MKESKKNLNSDHKVIDLKPIARNLPHTPSASKFGEFQLNDELIQSTSRIKNQRDLILSRFDKMKKSQTRVSPAVFEKVYRDYTLQLETITELLAEKKELLKKEVKELYRIRERISVEIGRHKEILEEAEFRHYLEEFTEEQFREVEQFESREIEKFEVDLSNICQLIRSHEELFDPQDLNAAPKQIVETTKTMTAAAFEESTSQPAHQTTSAFLQESTPANVTQSMKSQFIEVLEQEPEIQHKNIGDFEETPHPAPVEDFSRLLADEPEHDDHSIEQSQSHIRDLIEEPKAHGFQNKTFSANSDEDFSLKDLLPQQTHVVEKEEEEPDHLNSTDINIAQSFADEEKTSKKIPLVSNDGVAKQISAEEKEDSISEILESIHLEGENDSEEPFSEANQQSSQNGSGYRLTLLEGELDNSEFIIGENLSIGRSPSNDIALKAPKVSRQHAAINKYNDQYIIIDLKSSNGVFVNGAKIDEYVLNEGDEVSIGGYRFRFEKK